MHAGRRGASCQALRTTMLRTTILSLYTREKRFFKDMGAEIAALNAQKRQEAAAAAAAIKKKKEQELASTGGGSGASGSRTSSPRIVTAAALLGCQPGSSRAQSKSASAPGTGWYE